MTMKIEEVENGFICYREGHLPVCCKTLKELVDHFEGSETNYLKMDETILQNAQKAWKDGMKIDAIKLVRGQLFPGYLFTLRDSKILCESWN